MFLTVISDANFYFAQRGVLAEVWRVPHAMHVCSKNTKIDMYHSKRPVHQDVSFLRSLFPIMNSVIIHNPKAWVRPAVNMARPIKKRWVD